MLKALAPAHQWACGPKHDRHGDTCPTCAGAQSAQMNTLITWIAQYLLWVMVTGFALAWVLREDRSGRIAVALAAVIGVGLALGLMYAAKTLHHDPRPFVQNPAVRPLFGHSADDGFPSDHCVAAGLLTALVASRHRALGAAFGLGAVLIAWARVAAHVHHLQDVAAGLALGLIAGAVAVAAVRMSQRRRSAGSISGRAATHASP
jgi:membrane-associated phospholipid phosphatase